MSVTGVLTFIFVLVVLVFFHELGHFLFAKLFRMKVEEFAIGMGNPKLMAGTMGDVEVEIPSIEKQHEITEVLDKFDALLNGISIGLPAEIKARRQQYEYYRNKLLTFKELHVA